MFLVFPRRISSAWFFSKDSDAVDPGTGGFKGGGLVRAQIMAEYVVGDGNGLFLLEGDGLEPGGFDQGKIFAFLDGTCDTTCVHFSGFADFRGQVAGHDYVGYAEVS